MGKDRPYDSKEWLFFSLKLRKERGVSLTENEFHINFVRCAQFDAQFEHCGTVGRSMNTICTPKFHFFRDSNKAVTLISRPSP